MLREIAWPPGSSRQPTAVNGPNGDSRRALRDEEHAGSSRITPATGGARQRAPNRDTIDRRRAIQ